MGAVLPYPYLVRPVAEIAERFPHAWFGRPHVWQLPSVGDHDFVGQQRLAEAELKLAVLAQIHEDARVEPSHLVFERGREDAAAFLALAPLTSATFDRFFTLERLGFDHFFDVDRLGLDALRAVLPTSETDVLLPVPPRPWASRDTWSLREAWSRHIERRPDTAALLLAALRELVPRLLMAFAADLDGRHCFVHDLGEHVPREALEALRSELGVIGEGATALVVRVDRFAGPFVPASGALEAEVELAVHIASRVRRGRVRHLPRTMVSAQLHKIDDRWRVIEATLITEQRAPLP